MSFVTGEIVVETDGSLLIGGHTPSPAFLDAGTARDSAGMPILPASAVRGMLREALTRYLHAEGRSGEVPEAWSDPDAPEGAITRLFGRPGPNRPGMLDLQGGRVDRGGLSIEDAHLVGSGAASNVRISVGVDRATGHAVEGLLAQREVADVGGCTFRASFDGDATEADLRDLAAAAEAFGERIGNSRTRGLGGIRVALSWRSGGGANGLTFSPGRVDVDEVVVTLTAKTDLHLGDIPDRTSVRETLPMIPGSALLGALVWAVVDMGGRTEPGFAALTEASFADLWPTPTSKEVVAPRTRLACAAHPEHVLDSIVFASLAPRLLEDGGAPIPLMCPDPGCDSLLKPGDDRRPGTRLVTRLALDPVTGAAAPGMLHGRQQVVAGTQFVGTGVLPRGARELLAKLDRPIRIGGLRARGLGRVDVHFGRYDGADLASTVRRFDAEVQALVPDEVAAALGLGGRGWLQLVARTPLALPEGAEPGDAGGVLARAFPEGTRIVGDGHVRTTVRSGWRDRTWAGERAGPAAVRPVIAPGSTWLLRLPCPPTDPAVLAVLRRAATAGLGEGGALGLGRLDPPAEPLSLSALPRRRP